MEVSRKNTKPIILKCLTSRSVTQWKEGSALKLSWAAPAFFQVISLHQTQDSLLPDCLKPKGRCHHFGPACWYKTTCSEQTVLLGTRFSRLLTSSYWTCLKFKKRSFAEIGFRVAEEAGLHVCAGKGESGDALALPLCATPECSQGIHTISSLMLHHKMHQPGSEDPSLPFSNPLQRRLPRPVG